MNKRLALAIGFISIILIVVISNLFIKGSLDKNELNSDQVNNVEVPTDLTTEFQEATQAATEAPANIDGDKNPLTGLITIDELSGRRPIAVMLDNQIDARPQAALSEADIVYEMMAEGLITRYMAIFYGHYPEHIGPVRSARPYFIEKAFEFDPYYVHVGGSMQALSDIKKLGLADIDGLSSSAFWREKHKKAPHNMYTSSEVLVNDAIRLRYNISTEVSFLDFYDEFTVIEGQSATEITIVYKEPVQSDRLGYFTSYKYNDEEKVYYRYTNGEPHVDENSKVQLTCTNILVQYAKTKVLDNEGRLDVDLITSGEGKYFTSGKMIEVTWSKASAEATTEFFDLNGTKIKLNPGVTWFQIVKTGTQETIK